MKIAIIGGGASGCFAAANIPYHKDREVTVYEKTGKVLQKVKASGGGRCNVTHACFEVPELIERYPRGKQLLKKSLYQFTPQDTIEWFRKRQVAIKQEADGRMFPVTDSSQTIIDAIWQELMRQQVKVLYHKTIVRLEQLQPGFRLHFADGSTADADKVMIACGAFPKDEAYGWIRDTGHSVVSPVPSLFTFNMPGNPVTELMGVSVPAATVKVAGTKCSETGPLLITHWGMSGPAILRTSAWAAKELYDRKYAFRILVNWLTDVTDEELKQSFASFRRDMGKQVVSHKNPFQLPRRLWEYLLQQCGISDVLRWGELPAAQQNKLQERLLRDQYEVKGKTTFKEEFVTCGGVTLSEVNPQTMESRIVPGLYFGGEVLNVDGITGGFNFQHAWSSGIITAQHIIASEA